MWFSNLGLIVGEPCVLGQKHLCNVRYMSIITFRRDVLQVGYSPLSYYTLAIVSVTEEVPSSPSSQG